MRTLDPLYSNLVNCLTISSVMSKSPLVTFLYNLSLSLNISLILRITLYLKEASWIYLAVLEEYGGNSAT